MTGVQTCALPICFAHGFVVLSDIADFLYKTTDYYVPQHERSVAWNDAGIGIDWPLEQHGIWQPLLSEKDRVAPAMAQAETFA